MSKLAPSSQETVDKIERDRLVEEGNTIACPCCGVLLACGETPDDCRDPECAPLYETSFWDHRI